MNQSKVARVLWSIALSVVPIATFAINASSLIEAYGGGAPYYSRTTNMDKWANPLPVLAAVDTFIVVVVAFLILGRRRARNSPFAPAYEMQRAEQLLPVQQLASHHHYILLDVKCCIEF